MQAIEAKQLAEEYFDRICTFGDFPRKVGLMSCQWSISGDIATITFNMYRSQHVFEVKLGVGHRTYDEGRRNIEELYRIWQDAHCTCINHVLDDIEVPDKMLVYRKRWRNHIKKAYSKDKYPLMNVAFPLWTVVCTLLNGDYSIVAFDMEEKTALSQIEEALSDNFTGNTDKRQKREMLLRNRQLRIDALRPLPLPIHQAIAEFILPCIPAEWH